MMVSKLAFREKTALLGDIYGHLKSCSENFLPPLHEKVDIREYSTKLFENSVTFEAWDDSSLVGLVAAYLNGGGDCAGFITNVSVEKNFAGRGVATILMTMCLAAAKRFGSKVVNLEVSAMNTQAIRLYSKLGFQELSSGNGTLILTLSLDESRASSNN